MPIKLHTPRVTDDPIVLADWLEIEALNSVDGVGSLVELARQFAIGGVGDAVDEDQEEPRQFTDHPMLSEVMAEIEGRSEGCGEGYPFEIDGGGNYIIRKSDWKEYSYTNLLLISFSKTQKVSGPSSGELYPARLFEAISVTAAEKYLGGADKGAKSFHFASPRPDGSGFSDALKSLAALIQGRPQGVLEPSAEKDEGLDILAWRPFADSRCNFMCLFGQCATGDDWASKTPQPLEFLNLWLRLETSAVFPALFVPFTLDKREWLKKSQSVIIFDRCRISALVSKVEHGPSADQVRELANVLLAA